MRLNKEKALFKIAREIKRCSVCRRWGTGKAVPGEGNPDAGIVFIGEAPGREESVTGHPFVGRSGKLLRKTMKESGFFEEDVFITSPVKYLPFSGTPKKENIRHGSIHMFKQIAVINPGIIVLMGGTACFAVFERKIQVMKEHGKVIHKEGKKYFITFHPAYAFRFPEGRKGFVNDFKKLKLLVGWRKV